MYDRKKAADQFNEAAVRLLMVADKFTLDSNDSGKELFEAAREFADTQDAMFGVNHKTDE